MDPQTAVATRLYHILIAIIRCNDDLLRLTFPIGSSDQAALNAAVLWVLISYPRLLNTFPEKNILVSLQLENTKNAITRV